MNTDLTPRQNRILKAIIEEYITTADPVASQQLEKKFNLGVSPATIRNEMADLTDKGFLKQPHTSAGRIPTPQALRFFIDHLMQEKSMSLADEVAAKEQVWDARLDFDKLLRQTSLALATRTKSLAIVTTDSGDIYYSGVANILNTPEFYDIDVTRTVLSLLDEQQRLHQLFFSRSYGQEPVHIIFGQELGWPYFEPVGLAFTFFGSESRRGILAIVGPCRLNFPYIIPTLRYFSHMVDKLTTNW